MHEPTERGAQPRALERSALIALLAAGGVGCALAALGLAATGLGAPAGMLALASGGAVVLAVAMLVGIGSLSVGAAYRLLASALGALLLLRLGVGLGQAGAPEATEAALAAPSAAGPLVLVLAFLGWPARRALAFGAAFVALSLLVVLVPLGLGLAPPPRPMALVDYIVQVAGAQTGIVGLLLVFAHARGSLVAAQRRVASLDLIARTDALTETLNRRGIQELLEAEAARSLDRPCRLAVVLIDLDHFKRVNDVHGHAGGDRVLAEFGALLVRCVRTSDAVGRWGGEEFVVLLRRPSPGEALFLADRLRRAVEVHRFPVVDRMTASFGVAELAPGQELADAVAEADEALYRAKAGGRNKTVGGRSMHERMRGARG